MKTSAIKASNLSLKERVLSMPTSNPKIIRRMYGQLGVDIYEGKKASILTKKEQSLPYRLLTRLTNEFGVSNKHDYEEKDTLGDVLKKFIYNKKHGKDSEIEDMFGEKGVEEFNNYKKIGYVV